MIDGVPLSGGTVANVPPCEVEAPRPTVGYVLDSSVAAQTILDTTNGSRFASNYPAANASYILTGGPPGPQWRIDFSNCAVVIASSSQTATLAATLWAQNATFAVAPEGPLACAESPPYHD